MNVLITGISGLVGSYLAEFLLEKIENVKIFGTIRWRSRIDSIKHIKDKLTLKECDIRDSVSVRSLIKETKPDIIFHMASQSSVFASWHAPAETLTTNIIGAINFFEAMRDLCPESKILIPCSSEEYGLIHEDKLPVKETAHFHPLSPYAVSKAVQDLAGYQYERSYKLKIYRIRAFNHTGPRREPIFVESYFAKKIAEIEKGLSEPIIPVGNLEARRDYTDVRDMVRAYWTAIDKCTPGEVYNVCSGKVRSIGDVLNILLSCSDTRITIFRENDRMRPADAPAIYGDCEKFRKTTGWKPEIDFEDTLKDILDYWRERV